MVRNRLAFAYEKTPVSPSLLTSQVFKSISIGCHYRAAPSRRDRPGSISTEISKYIENAVIINVGDALELLSSG